MNKYGNKRTIKVTGIGKVLVPLGFLAIFLMLLSGIFIPSVPISVAGIGAAIGFIALGVGALKLSKIVASIFIAVGVIAALLSTILLASGDNAGEVIINLLPFLLMLIFLSLGIGMLVTPRILNKIKLDRCNYEIEGTIIRVKVLRHGMSVDSPMFHMKTQEPVYEYEFNGEKFEYIPILTTTMSRYNVGDTAIFSINPNNPKEVYMPVSKDTIIYLRIFGISLIVGAVVIIPLILFLISLI